MAYVDFEIREFLNNDKELVGRPRTMNSGYKLDQRPNNVIRAAKDICLKCPLFHGCYPKYEEKYYLGITFDAIITGNKINGADCLLKRDGISKDQLNPKLKS